VTNDFTRSGPALIIGLLVLMLAGGIAAGVVLTAQPPPSTSTAGRTNSRHVSSWSSTRSAGCGSSAWTPANSTAPAAASSARNATTWPSYCAPHRNRRTRPGADCAVGFLEVAAVKEYPGGYSLLRLYEGGYMVNFYKTRTQAARRWSATTRSEYFGLVPDYTLGTVAERNHVVLRHFSGLA
jgi:hypothetical protein